MFEPTEISGETAAKYAQFAMLASNCYHDATKPVFPVGLLHWFLVDRHGTPTDEPTREGWFTGFAYDIFENSRTNETVIAFRGTDSKQDWLFSNLAVPVSIPYKSALKAARNYIKDNPQRSLTVVGHSLGGGLALGVSVHYGVPAITFDPSPRIFDGLGDFHEPATRVIVFQQGEILERFRAKLIHKAYDVVLPEHLLRCDFDFDQANLHRIDRLAWKLADLGSGENGALRDVIDRVPLPD